MKQTCKATLLILLLPSQACVVTAKEGKAMHRQITYLNERMKGVEKYHQILMQAQEDIQKLKEIIERAAKNLGENTADFALQIDKMRMDLGALEGKVAELSWRIDTLAGEVESTRAQTEAKLDIYNKFFGVDKPLDPGMIPQDKGELWEKAGASMGKKEFETARGLLREYQKRYPKDPKSDDAQLMIGIAYLEEKSGAKALGELQKVIDNYPDSDRMDAVLFYMGEAFFLVQNCTDARTLFKAVIAQFPKSPYKKKSAEKIQEILKAPKNVCPTIK